MRLKKEIRKSIVQQIVKPTFNRGAWKPEGAEADKGREIPQTTERLCNKPIGTVTVRAARGVLKKGGFDRSAWQPSAEPAAPLDTPPAAPAPEKEAEKPVGFNKAAWKPKDV